jgi:ATP-binding cassette subfamily C (CFTR/MRP) protein 1
MLTSLPRPVIIVDWWSTASAKFQGHTNNDLYLGLYIGIGFLGAGFLFTELWSVCLLSLFGTILK